MARLIQIIDDAWIDPAAVKAIEVVGEPTRNGEDTTPRVAIYGMGGPFLVGSFLSWDEAEAARDELAATINAAGSNPNQSREAPIMLSPEYEKTAEDLKARILALIPANPHILEMESAWALFAVPGFACDDLGPSGAQATWALGRAQHEWKAAH